MKTQPIRGVDHDVERRTHPSETRAVLWTEAMSLAIEDAIFPCGGCHDGRQDRKSKLTRIDNVEHFKRPTHKSETFAVMWIERINKIIEGIIFPYGNWDEEDNYQDNNAPNNAREKYSNSHYEPEIERTSRSNKTGNHEQRMSSRNMHSKVYLMSRYKRGGKKKFLSQRHEI